MCALAVDDFVRGISVLETNLLIGPPMHNDLRQQEQRRINPGTWKRETG